MFQVNQQIGVYTLIKQIGRGGFGEVWLAERRTEILTTRVAVKLPHSEQVNLEAIRQEAQLWAQASGHANVLPIIEANIYDGQIVIVSEYAPDGSLEEKIQSQISAKQTLETVIGILNGLDFLHSRQIIHRDIKPANILLQGETPRLADFGISRVIKTTVHSASIVGTPKYMAPESFDGKRTAQTDIWSVGVILYQMLTGKMPYPQDNPTELMWAIVSKEFAPLPESIPPDLRKIVQKALAKVPENRFQSAREMREELQRALLNISHPAFAPTEVLEKTQADNYTIEDRSILVNPPLAETPQIISAPTHLVNKTVNQNQPQSNIPTEYNPILPTVPLIEPQYQEPPSPTVLQVTELTNQQKRGFHWGFYFLPLLVDLIIRLITWNLSENLGRQVWRGGGYDQYAFAKKMIFNIELPIEILVYGVLGFLFGYIFPSGKWKWGILLNIGFLCVIMLPDLESPRKLYFSLAVITTLVSCLTSTLGARLSPRKPVTELAESSEEWTTARIICWVCYFLALIIGLSIHLFIINFLVTIPLIVFIFFLIFFGGISGLFGYLFPQKKWKWGLWLNIGFIPAVVFVSYLDLFVISIIWGMITTITACLLAYLGSWLALRKAEKKVLQR